MYNQMINITVFSVQVQTWAGEMTQQLTCSCTMVLNLWFAIPKDNRMRNCIKESQHKEG